MIICRIIGGLGNQMFQYAAGIALADRLGVELKLDLRGFEAYSLHQGFELKSVFGVGAEAASDAEIDEVLRWRQRPVVARLLRHWGRFFGPSGRYVQEPASGYWTGFHALTSPVYLDGYWQSELYFASAAEKVREEFGFLGSMDDENGRLADRIRSVGAVSLHVRRGDYVSNPVTALKHGTCSPDYYQAALRTVLVGLADPHVFVFSDDLAWVRQHIGIDVPVTYVDHNKGGDSFKDMRLMSLCRRHVIANSSFSWWGAWLGRGPDKIVVAPARWFADANKEIAARYLCPEEWIRL